MKPNDYNKISEEEKKWICLWKKNLYSGWKNKIIRENLSIGKSCLSKDTQEKLINLCIYG